MSDVDGVRTAAKALMPEILEQLERLVAIPSVAFPGYPPEPRGSARDIITTPYVLGPSPPRNDVRKRTSF